MTSVLFRLRRIVMVQRMKSEFGGGIGGPVSSTDDPDKPSFDPATHRTDTDKRIRYLLEPHTINLLTDWEQDFLLKVYGLTPRSKKQHIIVSKIFQKHTRPATTGIRTAEPEQDP